LENLLEPSRTILGFWYAVMLRSVGSGGKPSVSGHNEAIDGLAPKGVAGRGGSGCVEAGEAGPIDLVTIFRRWVRDRRDAGEKSSGAALDVREGALSVVDRAVGADLYGVPSDGALSDAPTGLEVFLS